MLQLDSFVKRHDYLICVDSDGCVMDTMNCKHFHCFGPSLVTQWSLEPWAEEILRRWNEINLFQMTRGINRFRALAIILQEIDGKYQRIPGLTGLSRWVSGDRALSNDTLSQALLEDYTGEEKACLERALRWSLDVNEAITKLPDALKKPFTGVRSALAAAARYGDIAVVSGANREAVLEEWERYGLLPYANVILAQDCGSVECCIGKLLSLGYDPSRVLMVGDAPEDLEAATGAGICFYPIMVDWEEESWEVFTEEAIPRFALNSYADYQRERTQIFLDNLGG